jgi:hypothetical protein
MPRWKLFLKGLYDQGTHPPIVATGSARLDIAKRAGDSLAGRHFSFRLHPFTLNELHETAPTQASFLKLLKIGGFPEPYLSNQEIFPARWRRARLDIILRQDVIDLEQVRELNQLATLVQLLRTRVGSTVSLNSLSEDLQVDFSTVKRWLQILENLYVVFRVSPWSRNVARSLTKACKFYFYDNGQVLGDEGAKFENLVATALLRQVHWEQDTKGREISLHFLRNRNNHEIDFCIVEGVQITQMIEAKWAEEKPSSSFKVFSRVLAAGGSALQVVGEQTCAHDYPFGVRVLPAKEWLQTLTL